MTEYHQERILTEMEKVVITITGVFVDQPMLLETSANASNNTNAHDHDSDNDEEDTDGFEPSTGASSRASMRHKNGVYGARLVAWFDNIMSLLKLYSTCPTALNMAFEKHCKEVKSLFSLFFSSVVISHLFCYFLPILFHSFSPFRSSASCGRVRARPCPSSQPSSAPSWLSHFCRCACSPSCITCDETPTTSSW